MLKTDKKQPKTKRVVRVVECWALGLSAFETAKVMKDEGYRISVHTVYNDRHSTEAQKYVDELIRRQLRDIALADLEQKLNYRDKLIGKLVPQKIEAFQKTMLTEKREVTINVDGFSPEERRFAEHLARKYIKANNQAEPSSIH